ncbi:MAG: nicotinate-nucleotide adenylyltransferase [Gammaproteobacteria bacterium]|jgi:nicotinate-nucleotide adenylyltransferase
MIGIFGGTFNPIHNGHLQLARQVLEALALDEVHFLPCANPVHRGAPNVSGDDRLKLIKLAIAAEHSFIANTLELDRGGPSFMVDTLREVRDKIGNESICLMLGADAFNGIQGWKQSDEILNLAHLVVCQRPEIELNRDIYRDHWVQSVDYLNQKNHGYVLPLTINQSNCSSTIIREQLLAAEPTTQCLPPAVFEYIVNHHLYEN